MRCMIAIFYLKFIMILFFLFCSKNFPSDKVKAQLIEIIYADGDLVYYTSNKKVPTWS